MQLDSTQISPHAGSAVPSLQDSDSDNDEASADSLRLRCQGSLLTLDKEDKNINLSKISADNGYFGTVLYR